MIELPLYVLYHHQGRIYLQEANMSFPTSIPLQYWFYPTGNTPAVNLLHDGQAWDANQTANILLLACGDPRNILFSLGNEGEHGKFALGLSVAPIERSLFVEFPFNIILSTSPLVGLQPVLRCLRYVTALLMPHVDRCGTPPSFYLLRYGTGCTRSECDAFQLDRR